MELKIGDKAPDFTLMDTFGNKVKLSDFRGKGVVLYFYPKDDTLGCTKEACGFREDFKKFKSNDIEVIGVSLDDEESHKKFVDKFSLPFTLLCDTKADVSKKYGVYVQKNMYGKKFFGIKRTTFLIDKNGKISKVYGTVDTSNHSKEVLKEFSN